ncbi:MAG: cation-transporting P-type ATPase [Armatimonadota bacterium]
MMHWNEIEQWHARSTGDTVNLLESDGQEGLSADEVERRRQLVGPNVVTGRKGPGALRRFLQQFANPLVYVLLVAGTVTAFLEGHAVDAAVIFGVVLINAIIGYIQESKAKAAIEALSRMITVETTVVRNGQTRKVDAADLVPGDLVLVQSGDRIPADMRLLRLRDLHADESMLTGESLPVAKEYEALPEDTSLADRKNMAYSGTLVTFGQAAGLVVATGRRTELGRISHLIESAEELATPLTRRLGQFSILLSWVIVGLAVLTFIFGMLRPGEDLADTFIAAVALAVAAIPEGLPAAVTIILAIGVTRMAQRNAIIRKLPAVETLGSTSVICSDKTGTLTKNEMTVAVIQADGRRYDVTGTGYQPEGEVRYEGVPVPADDSRALREVLQAGVLCNDSRLLQQEGQWRVEGDPTEGALLTAAIKAGIQPEALRDAAKTVDTIPFESERQYMATLNRSSEHGRVIYVKGAVERLLALCTYTLSRSGETTTFDAASIQQQAEALAAEGLRVLAFAMKPAGDDQQLLHESDLDGDLVFLGLQGMIDPPRPEAISAVEACQRAGVTVKMITGDHALTARTIAQQIGIVGEGATVMSGRDLDQVADEQFPEIASRTHVFARVAPEQKLRLVQALQARDQVVAMTGDGVNDAPALKQANIGVAMGVTGTEAAKDAADMVLTDDNFASIEAAVEEGRGVYDNLRKFITWTLPTNGGEGLLILVAIVLGIALPILPVHVLWINLTTAVALGMMLAFEPKEPGLMRRAARDPSEPILTRALIWRTAYVSVLMVIGAYALFEWELRNGIDLAVARTTVANVVVLVELVYLFNCRSLTLPVTRLGFFSNHWSIIGAGLMIVLQLLFVYAPFMQALFDTAPMPPISWLEVAMIALVIFGIVEIEKWLRRRQTQG